MSKDSIRKLKFLVLLMAVSNNAKERKIGLKIIDGYLKAKKEHEQRQNTLGLDKTNN